MVKDHPVGRRMHDGGARAHLATQKWEAKLRASMNENVGIVALRKSGRSVRGNQKRRKKQAKGERKIKYDQVGFILKNIATHATCS